MTRREGSDVKSVERVSVQVKAPHSHNGAALDPTAPYRNCWQNRARLYTKV
jgi:hypothetical protein